MNIFCVICDFNNTRTLFISCKIGFSFDYDDCGSEAGSFELNFLTGDTHRGYTVLKVVSEFVIT